MRFQTRYNLSHRTYEKPSGPSQVERAGYIPAKARIEALMLAGARLVQSRAEMYDYPNSTPDDDFRIDPTRSPNFDMVDADILKNDLKAKLSEQAKADKEKAAQAAASQEAAAQEAAAQEAQK